MKLLFVQGLGPGALTSKARRSVDLLQLMSLAILTIHIAISAQEVALMQYYLKCMPVCNHTKGNAEPC